MNQYLMFFDFEYIAPSCSLHTHFFMNDYNIMLANKFGIVFINNIIHAVKEINYEDARL